MSSEALDSMIPVHKAHSKNSVSSSVVCFESHAGLRAIAFKLDTFSLEIKGRLIANEKENSGDLVVTSDLC